MTHTTEICSLSEFQRDTNAHIKQVTSTKQPIKVMVNDGAEVVVQDANVYQKMIEDLEDLRMAAVREGEADIATGRTISADQMWKELATEFNLEHF